MIKRPLNYDHEIPKVFDREIKNYRKLSHPFLPIFYGIIDDKDYIIIEFINGKTLGHIKKMKLTFKDILNIIFELLLIFYYFYNNHMLYRDLKTNNIMINENKEVFLIDFNSLIEYDENKDIDFHIRLCDNVFCS